MLMRTDPFRELDRFAQQVLGTAARPAVMPMDAWREGDKFVVASMLSVSRFSPRNSCRLNTPRGRSAATIS
ncbi:hypothetical protein AIIKEEIJ_01759 [Rhodococcus sp. YH1]|nr:hypothetical protein [Rhodococcus sp. YH1]